MFQELMPLLSQRVLILTLSRVTDEELCVNVIPKPLKSDQQNEDNALTTPLAVTGTPKELDEQLPKQLVEFVEIHLGLSSTLKSAKEQIDAAAKAARESARKSTSSKSDTGSGKATFPSSTQVPPEATAKESAMESPISAVNAHGSAAEGGLADTVATTGSLFDVEVKADV
jgi:PRTRC genetic system protein E